MISEIIVLTQFKVTEDKGEDTIFHEAFKTRTIRLNMGELLARGRELEAAEESDEDVILPLLDQCEKCQGALSLLLDETRTSADDEVVFCTANIFCQNCSPSKLSPTFVISTVYDTDGAPVQCECLRCDDCHEPSVTWLEGTVICWPCIKKHNLKKSLLYEENE